MDAAAGGKCRNEAVLAPAAKIEDSAGASRRARPPARETLLVVARHQTVHADTDPLVLPRAQNKPHAVRTRRSTWAQDSDADDSSSFPAENADAPHWRPDPPAGDLIHQLHLYLLG